MKHVPLYIATAAAFFVMGWMVYPRVHPSENTDAVAGVAIGAFYDALDRIHPNAKPAPAPDELNVALTMCDFRRTMAPKASGLDSRDECAVRVMGWTKYWTEQQRAKRTSAVVAPPFKASPDQ